MAAAVTSQRKTSLYFRFHQRMVSARLVHDRRCPVTGIVSRSGAGAEAGWWMRCLRGSRAGRSLHAGAGAGPHPGRGSGGTGEQAHPLPKP